LNAALYPSGTANAGKLMVVVSFPAGNSGVARYNPDGSLDSTFGTGGEVHSPGTLFAAAIAADGKIDAVGINEVLRYNADGSVDNTFGTDGTVTFHPLPGNSLFEAVALQSNGDIVAAGWTSGGVPMQVARFLPSEPEIGSFTSSASTVTSGSAATLTASNITDANPNATITKVTFYYIDSSGTQQVLGTVTQTSPGVWTLTSTTAFGLGPGTYTVYAQAEDSYLVFGDPLALTLTVQ
jgi:uncharacterized delta-60 repeat protein